AGGGPASGRIGEPVEAGDGCLAAQDRLRRLRRLRLLRPLPRAGDSAYVARSRTIDHVCLGSDFDGIPAGPAGLEDVSKLLAVIAALRASGYRPTELERSSAATSSACSRAKSRRRRTGYPRRPGVRCLVH